MTKAFPLYDELAELCDAVIATGAGAFRGTVGTDEGMSEHGSDGETGGWEDFSSGQEDELAGYIRVGSPFVFYFWWQGLTMVKDAFPSMPPPALPSKV